MRKYTKSTRGFILRIRQGLGNAKISVDNGNSFTSPSLAIESVGMDFIRQFMTDEIVSAIITNLEIESDVELLDIYLSIIEKDLIIG